MIDTPSGPIVDVLNKALGMVGTGMLQHRVHVKLLRNWGLDGLASQMEARTADEPETFDALLERLLDLGGAPDVAISKPNIGTDLASVLGNDISAQREVPALLNEMVEVAADNHDATTRRMLEEILADEEQHLYWLTAEQDFLEQLGDSLYRSTRMGS